jgi:hypothetical protein
MSPAVAVAHSSETALSSEMTPLDPEMIEVVLLMPRWQAVALQQAAKQRGMSAAQMLRRLIGVAIGAAPTVADNC